MIVEVPKRPVRRGRRGSFRERFRVAIPKNPARRKINRLFCLFFVSVMRKIEIQMRTQDIILSIKLRLWGIIKNKRGITIARRMIADVDPISVKITALCAFPFKRYWCPGRTESAVSSSGAPR